MGCHTWFYKPLTKDERERLRETANKYLLEELSDNRYYKMLSKETIDKLSESIENDSDMWLEWGLYEYEDFIEKIEEKFYVEVCNNNRGGYCCEIKENFHDNFRVKNYPKWIIHNRHELRKKMRKKYFELTQEQLNDISRFFKLYPGGIITFG